MLVAAPLRPAAQPSQWEWTGVSRIVAMGDVHASFDKLVSLLRGTDLVDSDLAWTGGETHLVLCGDLTDRGSNDRAVLDLLRRLQKEAAASGGYVHALLGNHDVMNLIRDLRYVAPDSYADFASEEDPQERERGWKGFKTAASKPGVDPAAVQAAFEKRHPPGYFARLEAFGLDGEYGTWLLAQPVVVKVNGIVFLHGGLTPEVAALGLDEINRRVHKSVRAVMEAIPELEGAVTEPAAFEEIYGAAATQASTGGGLSGRAATAARVFLEQLDELPFDPSGPLWYRGLSLENERAERYKMDEVLELLDARAVMVGHTPTDTAGISTRFDGALIRGDVGMAYGEEPRALVIEGENAMVFDPVQGSLSPPIVEPIQGQGWSGACDHLPDSQLEKLLLDAKIKKRTEVQRGTQKAEIWEMEGKGLQLRAVFKDIKGKKGSRYQHELAAYWLDRRLGLGFVPVVITRKVDGKTGALRAIIESAIDVVAIREYGNLADASRPELIRAVADYYHVELKDLQDQVTHALTFDALIGNLQRKDWDKLFVPGELRIAIVDHEAAFVTSPEVPNLPPTCRQLDPEFVHALKSLDEKELKSGVGDYLSKSQITALLARRDRILESCAQ